MWYRYDFKKLEKELIKLLSDKSINRDIVKNTLYTINNSLAQGASYNNGRDLLKRDYYELMDSVFWWSKIDTMAEMDIIKPNYNIDTEINLKKKELIELIFDFFKNGTNNKTYSLFNEIYEKNKKRVRYYRAPEKNYCGECIYLEYFDQSYITVFNTFDFDNIPTLAHEFGHAIQFSLNYDLSLFNQNSSFSEIVSLFFELICNDYFYKYEIFKNESTINSLTTLNCRIKNSKDISKELKLIELLNVKKIDNLTYEWIDNIDNITLQKNINDLIIRLGKEKEEKLVKKDPSSYYIYCTSFIVACNLFIIYKRNPEFAFDLLYKIINFNKNLDSEMYYIELSKLGLTSNTGIVDYQKGILKRLRKL